MQLDRKKVLPWAFYDWANSAFATSVMAGFFPVCFKQYWSAQADVSTSTFYLGTANSIAGLSIALCAPLLGAIADTRGAKKGFLGFFALLGILMTGSLALVNPGQWQLAAACYIAALIGFAGGNIFYDSLLVAVAPPEKADLASALGYALGYLGGGLLFALNVAMVFSPQTFGLADAHAALRVSFLTVALWWAVFSVPLFSFLREPRPQFSSAQPRPLVRAWSRLAGTFRRIRRMRVIVLFLLAYWLYIDAVDTIILMAVDYGLSLGLSSQSLIFALLITQFVGFPAALAFGILGERLGTKRALFIGIAVYLLVTVWAFLLKSEMEFYILAVTVGLVQGGVQSLSRSFYSRIIPKTSAAEFFGFYNMLGKFAAVIGPLLLGWVSLVTGNPRCSILSIGLLFITGGIILSMVDEKSGQRMAAELEKG